MESHNEIYKSLCRVCLEHGNSVKMVNLLENSNDDGLSYYGKAVSTFAVISIKTDANFPSMMCEKCLYLLKQAIKFKFKCELSQKRLELISKYKPNNELCQQNIIENVVEYALFTQYFPNIFAQESSTKPTRDQAKCANFDEVIQENIRETLVGKDSFNDNDDSDEIPLKFLNKDSDSLQQCDDDILDIIEKIIERDSNKMSKHEEVGKRKIHKRKLNLKPKRKLYKIKSQKDQSEIVCKICNKVLANKSTFAYHIQRHTGCRFICEHCGKGFPVLSELQFHLISSHGLGPTLQCSHCSFKAPRKFDLMEHERKHTGERPYTCEKCGLTFRRRGIWKKHLVHHNEKTVQCPLCPRKFYQRGDLVAHKNNVHERLYVYLCNKCGATYAKTDTVRKHMMDRHGIPRQLQGKITRINKGRAIGFPESTRRKTLVTN